MKFIVAYQERRGMPPTRAEIAMDRGCNRATAQQHLKALERKGRIQITPGSARGIQLIGAGKITNDMLPLIGRVAAGPPVLATEEIDDYYKVDPRLFRPRADYLRRVTGSSMIDLGIRDGDLIGVKSIAVAENNQIVVAKLFRRSGIELTVKKFRQKGSRIQLIAFNDVVAPVEVNLEKEQFEIEGLYCGHIHKG